MSNWDLENGRVSGACGPYPWPAGWKDDSYDDDDEFADEDDEENEDGEEDTSW